MLFTKAIEGWSNTSISNDEVSTKPGQLQTHSKYQFAAATVADGIDFGYAGCVFFAHSQPTCEKINGGPPYGDSLENWRKMAFNFNLDKMTAPLLLQSILGPLGEWETYSGLHWLKKPTELLNFYPDGVHTLVKPGQRMTSQQTTGDWFDYWINGRDDPNPAKAEQYSRWRELRKLQDAQDAERTSGGKEPVAMH